MAKGPRKNVMPYQQPEDRLGVIRGSKYRRIPPKLVTERGTVENLTAENFAKKFPRLDEAAKMVALARMGFYGLPQNEMDKFHGWIEGKDYGDFPEELVDQVVYVPESKSYRLRDDSSALDEYEPEVVQRILAAIGQDFPEGVPEPTLTLKHVAKDSVPEGTQFYPSTQQYLNDVLFSQGYSESDVIKEAAYDLARKYLEDMAIEDAQLPKEQRKYDINIRKMLNTPEGTDYTIADLNRHFREGLVKPAGEFDATPGAGYWLQGMLNPTRAAVTQDPELERKTSRAEKVARTGYDLAKWYSIARLPELALQGLAKNFVPFAAHPILGRTALGGAAGAMISPVDYFIGDPIFEKTTGYGATHHPLDLANVAADALIGAGLSGAGATLNPIGSARYTARQKMVSQPSGSEALGALKAEARERGLKPNRMGKLVSREMLNDELAGVPHNPPRGSGEKSFAEKAFEDYDKKYPGSAWRYEALPEPTVNVKNSRIANFFDKEVRENLEQLPLVQDETAFMETTPKMNREAGVRVANIGGYEVPVDFHAATPQFMQHYLAEHPELTGISEEFTTSLPYWLNKSVPYGSAERRWFGNKPIVMSDVERRKVMSALKGSSNKSDLAKSEYMRTKGKLGTANDGKFTPADATQTKLYEKAKKNYKLRQNLRELTPEEIELYKKGHVVGLPRRIGDYITTSVIRPAAINLYPTGSKVMDKLTGKTTVPYSYEAYPEDK